MNAQSLTVASFALAANAARCWLDRHHRHAPDDVLTAALKAQIAAALPAALADSKDAFDCGMDQAAAHTFQASMVLAGVAAAKAAACPVHPRYLVAEPPLPAPLSSGQAPTFPLAILHPQRAPVPSR